MTDEDIDISTEGVYRTLEAYYSALRVILARLVIEKWETDISELTDDR